MLPDPGIPLSSSLTSEVNIEQETSKRGQKRIERLPFFPVMLIRGIRSGTALVGNAITSQAEKVNVSQEEEKAGRQ